MNENLKYPIENKTILNEDIKNNWKFLSGTKKYRIINTETVVKLRVPSIPSK